MMPDREKVIGGLESLRDVCNAKADMAIGEGRTAWAGYASVAHLALALLREQEPVGVWISVKDRLPEKPGRYLCWFGKNTFAVGASIVPYIPDLHWFASLESLERYENVTHWMPLPEPPKEDDGK